MLRGDEFISGAIVSGVSLRDSRENKENVIEIALIAL